METIPQQLKDCYFNRVLKFTKKPFEIDWTNKRYTYQEISKYFPKENYGVMTGINELGVLDDDSNNKILIKLFENNFKESFRVRDHYYIKLIGWDGKKIIFYNSNGEHLGELQGLGQMVVGAGSTHPSGSIYDLKKDIPIKEILIEKFNKVFNIYIKKEKEKIIREHKSINWSGDNITDIPIGNIISFNGLIDMGNGCYQGPHPKHGSDNGMNFRVDINNNIWHCFRCQSGGGPSELIAVMEGIIDCSKAGPKCYTEDQAREVIKIAREKYKLSTPEPIKKDLGPVIGWANSVSILKLSKKYNFENCYICGRHFKFEDSYGLYYCEYCKFGGGLNKFAKLISDSLNKTSITTI